MRLFLLVCFLLSCQYSLLAQDFNILDYGAIPDGKTLNTESIQATIDAANARGGGRVIVPKGSFLAGTFYIKSGVELHLEKGGIILGSTNPEDYDKIRWWKAFVVADHQEDISITGKGHINGQGRQLALQIDSLFHIGQIDSVNYDFEAMRPKERLRPMLVGIANCKNVSIQNITLKNASCWVQMYDQCENLNINNIRVDSDAYWNNDGIDISDCKNVRLTNSYFNSADDGICLKSHKDQFLCDNVYIANCTVRSSASAIKFGTKSLGGFKNVTIRDIKVFDTFRSAVAIESVDGGILEDVLIENITAKNTGNAIFIRLGNRKRKKTEGPGTLKNVTLRNIKVEIAFERPDYAYQLRGPALDFFHNTFPASITGLPETPVEEVLLENIAIIYPGRGNKGLAYAPLSRLEDIPELEAEYPEFSMFGELPAWGFYVRHMDGLKMKNIQLRLKAPDYRPAFVFDDVNDLTIQNLEIKGDKKEKSIFLHNTTNVELDSEAAVLRK